MCRQLMWTCGTYTVCQGVLETIKFFFGSNRNKPKLNLFRLLFGLFRETKKHFFRFVSVCFGVSVQSKQPNKQNFFKINRKHLQKSFSFRGSSKPLFFFLGSNRNKLKLNLFRLFFGLLFCKTQKNFSGLFWFVSMFRTGIKTTKTNRTYGMGNLKV